MPGLFAILPKSNCCTQVFLPTFLAVKQSLDFFNYDVKTYVDEKVMLGTIGPSVRQDAYRCNRKGKEYICIIDGEVVTVDGTGQLVEMSAVFELILDVILSENYAELAKVNGDYNVFIYSRSEHVLSFVSDRFGLRKVYCAETDDALFIFPDLYACTAISQIKKTINLSSLAQHVLYTYPITDDTFLKGISVLPNASVVKSTPHCNGLEIASYWQPEIRNRTSKRTVSLDECSGQAFIHLENAVERRLNCSDNIISLSGGLDSRTIAGLAVSKTQNSIRSVSYGYKGSYECRIAAKVAKALHLTFEHKSIASDYIDKVLDLAIKLTDGVPPALQFFHLYAINDAMDGKSSRQLRHLSGFYGDLLLGGSKVSSPIFENNMDDYQVLEYIENKLTKNFIIDWDRSVFTNDFLDVLIKGKKNFFSVIQDLVRESPFEAQSDLLVDNIFIQNHARRYLSGTSFYSFYATDLKPFFDYDFYDFYLRIPWEYRRSHILYNNILKQQLPEMASIPYDSTGRQVGVPARRTFQMRKKYFRLFNYNLSRLSKGNIVLNEPHNYVQFNKWFFSSRTMIEVAVKTLRQEQTLDRKIVSRVGLDRIYEDFMKGKWVGSQIMNLYFLEKWFRIYVDGEKLGV
jgi:asparagine synthetase B (glutamine-hydrolysing)